ncbi:MAG: HlyD family type I secretion periplasmic adaptor subunit [Gammaproteobacteria bacterium]|jgi:adhesin transport system membrane fusion protein
MKKDNEESIQNAEDFDMLAREDFDFISSKSKAILLKSPAGARNLMLVIGVFFIIFIIWASYAETDEMTKAIGKVVPEKKLHILQSLEGGIISEIFVKVGEIVKTSAPLIRIDDTQHDSSLQEISKKIDVLNAKRERLLAELENRPLNFSRKLKASIPNLLDKEEALYNSRTQQFLAQQDYFNQKINEVESKQKYLKNSLELTKRELDAIRPLLQDKAVSEVEVLKVENIYNEINSNYASAAIELKATTAQRDEKLLIYRNDTQELLSDVIGNIRIIRPSEIGAKDRVTRALIRSPIDGIVQRVLSNTIGTVVQPGVDLIEIIPLEDTLLVEAKIKPTDIGFITEGQNAMIKFTAFDFTIYGGIEGKLVHISPDAIVEKKGTSVETFYRIQVKTNKNYLGAEDELGYSRNQPLKIIPGMEAEVDIITGKKTVLDFLFKPVLRARYGSLHER